MAKENVKKFYEEISENRELREKLQKAQQDYTGDKDDRGAVLEAVLFPIAKEAGYEFTAEELKEAEKELLAEKGISEEELENVSGGILGCFVIGTSDGAKAIACMGSGLGSSNTSLALGAAVCFYIGIGWGAE